MSEFKWQENVTEDIHGPINETVSICTDGESACFFPFCEEDLACDERITLQEAIDRDNLKEETVEKATIQTTENVDKPANTVAGFFECQKQLNQLEEEKQRLKKEKAELFNKLKVDIETIFLALDCEELGTKITLTDKGLNISYPVRVFNKYQTTLVDTDLFTQLNKLLGMKGKLSMAEETKVAGNMVRVIELIYEI